MNYNRNELKVKGKMSNNGADRVATIQAIALLIASTLFGIAAVIYAVSAL